MEKTKKKSEIDTPAGVKVEKQTRARSAEDKSIQFNRIIQAGMDLINAKGFYGFGMRSLARHLDMSQGNLYNYVNSKRELWIAIRQRHLQVFKQGIDSVIIKHNGTNSDLLIKIFDYVIDFAMGDQQRWNMLSAVPPPASDVSKPGPIESKYRPFNVLEDIRKIVAKAIHFHEIKEVDDRLLTYYLYAIVMGLINVENEISRRERIYEPILYDQEPTNSEEFRKFAHTMIRKQLLEFDWKY